MLRMMKMTPLWMLVDFPSAFDPRKGFPSVSTPKKEGGAQEMRRVRRKERRRKRDEVRPGAGDYLRALAGSP